MFEREWEKNKFPPDLEETIERKKKFLADLTSASYAELTAFAQRLCKGDNVLLSCFMAVQGYSGLAKLYRFSKLTAKQRTTSN
jgi:hypothetical protein